MNFSVPNNRHRYIIKPDTANPRLTTELYAMDQNGARVPTSVPVERPLTLYLNGQEIVTMMTINDYPEFLAIGYLRNQNMLHDDDVITGVDYDKDIATIVVRTSTKTNFEEKLKKKTLTSGCAQGTAFGDVMESFETTNLPENTSLHTSTLFPLIKTINTTPSLYMKSGAIHGCVLCNSDQPLVYMEDVGRHNAVDKITGWMFENNICGGDKLFYTTGRMTSEMVIKTVQMGIPVLISRSGSTAWGIELARKAGLIMIGRARGQRFIAFSGEDRIGFDAQKNS